MSEAQVTSGDQILVGLVQNYQIVKWRSKTFYALKDSILRAVVNHNDLQRLIYLGSDTFQGLTDVPLTVVDRYDDGYTLI